MCYTTTLAGLEFVQQLALENDERAGTLLSVSNKSFIFLSSSLLCLNTFRYYALSAVCALLKYAEYKLNQRYAIASLRIRYTPVEGSMMIDLATAKNLELVTNVVSKRSSHSLFGSVVDYDQRFCSSHSSQTPQPYAYTFGSKIT
jgi:DNA mismatch repair protein MSH4